MSTNKILSRDVLRVTAPKLKCLKKFGIQNFGYRQFKDDGNSIGFCTYNHWEEIEKKDNFFESMSIQYEKELLEIGSYDTKYIVRSGEVNRNSIFLSSMFKWGLWNSLVLYKRNYKIIEGYYFIASPLQDISIINYYINYREYFDKVATLISNDIRKIIAKPQYLPLEFNLFSFSAAKNINLAFRPEPNKVKGLTVDKLYFTNRERETMVLISHGYTMKDIAHKFNISPRTVEKYITFVKQKLGINSKGQIIDFVQENHLTYL